MVDSDNNTDPKHGTSKNNKFNRFVICYFGWIAVVFGLIFWILESAIYSYIFHEGTFFRQLATPTVNEVWMRSLVMFIITAFGFSIQFMLKRISESKVSQLRYSPDNLRRYTILIIVFWTMIVSVSLSWNILQEHNNTTELGLSKAREAFNKDVICREWVASHGGVYVPVTKNTPPNPYLSHIKEQNIETPSGKKLTLVNPAYMVRQARKIGKEEYGIYGRITSLNPIRKENAPDIWEQKAMEAFLEGSKEVSSSDGINDEPYVRLIRPLTAKESCMKCHADHGYKVGDIQGAISVAVPMRSELAMMKNHIAREVTGHFLLWMIGALGIGYGSKQFQQQFALRRETEVALQESERQMREILSNVQLATVMLDKEGSITYVNNHLLEMTGYSREEIIGGNWFNIFIPAELREEMKSVHKRVISGKLDIAGHYENEILTKSGQRRIVAWSNTLFKYSAERNIIGSSLFGEDITSKKEIENRLKDSEKKNRAWLEQSPICTKMLDIDFNLQYMSTAGIKTLRIDNINEFYGKPYPLSIFPESYRNTMTKILKKVRETGGIDTLEASVVDLEGNELWFHSTLVPVSDDEGQIDYIIVVSVNISERKQAERELQKAHDELEQQVQDRTRKLAETVGMLEGEIIEHKQAENALRISEERFRTVVEQSTSAIEIYEPNGRLMIVNDAWVQFWDLKKENVADFNIFDDSQCEATGLTSAFRNAQMGCSHVIPDILYDPEESTLTGGRKRCISARIYPITDQAGKVQNIILAYDDITERIQAEEKVKKHQAELLHMSRLTTMGEMASGLAHELNQPLSAISSYTTACMNTMKTDGFQTEILLDDLQMVVSQAQRAGEIIKRIRDFLKKRTPDKSIVNVNDLVKNAMVLVANDVKKCQVQLKVELSDQIKAIPVDSIQIEQVFLNIVYNAIEAMADMLPQNKLLTVQTRMQADEKVEIVVCDRGVGISDEVSEKMFDSFFTTKPAGMGMGLSISRTIIEAHYGMIFVKPGKTEGTEIVIQLPI